MKWRSQRVSPGALLLLAGLGVLAAFISEQSQVRVKRDFFEEKVEASRLAHKAMLVLKSARGETAVIDPVVDPNATGLIGDQFTIITTDQGSLTSKLTSTNPNLSAVVVEMLCRAGVKKGDRVAVGLTGSMPAMNIAVLSAIEIIGARPVIISSVGSSMWGANNPSFSWLDMERVLFEKGLIHHRTCAASLGGRGDRGGNVSPEGRRVMRELIEKNGITLIEKPTLEEAIEARMKIYADSLKPGEHYAAYINVGGGLASVGSAQNLVPIKPGLNMRLPIANYPIKGVMIRMGQSNVPIINFSDIIEIAHENGLPIAPEPLPDVPHGEIYFMQRYSLSVIVPTLIIYLIIVFVVIRVDVASMLFRKKG